MTRADATVQVHTLKEQARRLAREGKLPEAQQASRLARQVQDTDRPIMGKLIRNLIRA